MTTKQEILAYAKQNGFIYPKFKVGFYFGLFGGIIGLMATTVILFIYALITNSSSLFSYINTNVISIISGTFQFVGGVVAFGIVFGCIPALLTGIYCAVFNFIIMKKLDYIHLYVVGTIFSAIYFNHWLNLPDEFWQRLYDLW
ncbi:hypothetical protein [Moraxella oblonga]|uniref:hypothetical protein n=1 Tax=Moraxella oblonga TaxID=200413 RepID=UPI00082D0EB8|nr:hypothetical protein [Moraxella oblonga]